MKTRFKKTKIESHSRLSKTKQQHYQVSAYERKNVKLNIDDVGDYINRELNNKYQDREWTSPLVRQIAEEKYGKKAMSKFSDKDLRDAWFQYEPQ